MGRQGPRSSWAACGQGFFTSVAAAKKRLAPSIDMWQLLLRLRATCVDDSISWDHNQERVQKHVYAVLLLRLKHLSACLDLDFDFKQCLLYQLMAVYEKQEVMMCGLLCGPPC
jgi:hypothetical protein